MSDAIKRVVHCLSRLPGIGEKTATRLALHLVRGPKDHVRELAEALAELTERVGLCNLCKNLTEDERCELCRDARRDPSAICVVASPADVLAIEQAGEFRGRYHVLHGLLSPLEGIGPDDLYLGDLIRRLESPEGSVEEVIVATSANVEGESTAMYLARLIKPLGVRVTRIATGLPAGGELEFTDRATISRALSGRTVI